MVSYVARVHSNDKRFDDLPITLRTFIEVHPNTRLNSIEDIDEDANSTEIAWYNKVVNNNVKVNE